MLCYFAFITFSEVFEKMFKCFSEMLIFPGTKINLEPTVKLLYVLNYENLSLGPWRSVAPEFYLFKLTSAQGTHHTF